MILTGHLELIHAGIEDHVQISSSELLSKSSRVFSNPMDDETTGRKEVISKEKRPG
jgi:hypothetical protein